MLTNKVHHSSFLGQ